MVVFAENSETFPEAFILMNRLMTLDFLPALNNIFSLVLMDHPMPDCMIKRILLITVMSSSTFELQVIINAKSVKP